MLQELEVIFDGKALQLETPLNLAAGTRLRVIIESVLPNKQQSKSLPLEDSAVQETLYLLSIPKMRASILEGLAMPIEECDRELEW